MLKNHFLKHIHLILAKITKCENSSAEDVEKWTCSNISVENVSCSNLDSGKLGILIKIANAHNFLVQQFHVYEFIQQIHF